MPQCPICDNKNTEIYDYDTCFRFVCPYCGEFNIGDARNIPKLSEEEKIKFRWWLYQFSKDDKRRFKISLTNENKDEFLEKIILPTILEKIDLVFEFIYSKTYFLGAPVPIDVLKDYRLFFCKDVTELEAVLQYLYDKKFLAPNWDNSFRPGCDTMLTPEGIKYIEEIGKKTNSKQCFVAMWFNDGQNNTPNTNKAYSDSIVKAIEDSGFEKYRVDKDSLSNEWIPDTIVKQIKKSKFMVADLTGNRGGVYYEAGFAEGLGMKVIYTCNEKWFNEQCNCPKCGTVSCTNESVHFNLKQRKMILWDEEKLEEFRTALAEKIGALIGVKN
jgi:nucleoside 2-deoxyribosyltransferase/predicted RNA-binding Zn-ribbon protein involved in translation (DUF1610 family)